MAAVSASMVKELRERTSLGMMECKKALAEAGGDIELAIENLLLQVLFYTPSYLDWYDGV